MQIRSKRHVIFVEIKAKICYTLTRKMCILTIKCIISYYDYPFNIPLQNTFINEENWVDVIFPPPAAGEKYTPRTLTSV